MTLPAGNDSTLHHLDDETRALVRLAAFVTAADELTIRDAIAKASKRIRPVWVEELLLQTYLFAGFPRALNAMREWRRVQPTSEPDHDVRSVEQWRADGERTCSAVYGTMYDKLRGNIRHLHERLDDWMITEGYGKVLSRPGLDLGRRELCIVAACAAANQDRQLHSHLHGALNVGVKPDVVSSAIDVLADVVGQDRYDAVRMLWSRVRNSQVKAPTVGAERRLDEQ
ncbi:MAG TPA: carboxymuconolactone decarboxylase family protein [Gemmatimonadaceae bacterium]|jgi:4-carboxymuconolactone decarboxylase